MRVRNDTILVSRAALMGDKGAFNELVLRYQSSIRRFLYSLCKGDIEMAEDLSQDTFIKAWIHIKSFKAASKFSTWLYRIAYNTFCDYVNKNKYNGTSLSDIVNIGYDNFHNIAFNIDFLTVISCLTESERTICLLYYMEDLTVENISKITRIPVGTVKSHLHRTKKKIINILDKSN